MIGPLPWIGGKNRLASKIISLFPKHMTYVEPFAGGAQVFFHKEPSKIEVLNDMDGQIVNFFRISKEHPDELIRILRSYLVSRKWYDLLSKTPPEVLTDIQKACQFYYLQKNSFGGRVIRQNYVHHVANIPNFNPARIPVQIKEVAERLQNVQIECLPYEQVLERFDRHETLFYLDPPYYQKYLYRFNLADNEFELLASRLRALRGKFILSLNDVPQVRKLFSDFTIIPVELAYSAQKNSGNRYQELIIKNC